MRRFWWILTISFILIITLNFSALAARRPVDVMYNNDNGTGTSQITLSWQFATGDKLYRTWDGRTWTEITIPAPLQIDGQQISIASDVIVPYYANIYFEIRKQAYTVTDRTNSSTDNYVTIPVYPPLKNAHSDFSANTGLCGYCHVTHAADGQKLIRGVNNTELCKICHGPGAPGSRYSVWDGTTRLKDGSVVKSLGGPIAAGPTTPWGADATSSHMYGLGPTPGYTSPTIRLPGQEFNCLEQCHKPHANSNNYRLLEGSAETIAAWVYNPTGLARETAYYETFDSAMCNTCHSRFYGAPDSARHLVRYDPAFPEAPPQMDPYTNQYVYTHTAKITDVTTWNGGAAVPSQPVPLLKDKVIFCLSCHYPHGTTVTGAIYSAYDKNQNGLYDDSTTALKRMDNSGICQNCHKK
ncbi:MAG: hypothetical protein ACYC21_13890 [Eubacteriales bacterium]